jgi:hypothetical protein
MPSVRFAQPRLEVQPDRAARQNEHQRQTGNAHVFHAGRQFPFSSDYSEYFSMDDSDPKRESTARARLSPLTASWFIRQSSRSVIGRLRSAPERAKAAVGLGFERWEKAFRTDGAADAF